MTLSSGSIDTNAHVDMVLSRGLLEFFRSCWLDGTGVDWHDPRVNLLEADLRGLPSIAIYYGTHEWLADEAAQLALRAKAAGNDHHLRPAQDGQHSLIMGAGRVPEVMTPSRKWGSGCVGNFGWRRSRDPHFNRNILSFNRNRGG